MTVKTGISLTDEHARLIESAVATGDYASTSEVVREALRNWRALGEIRRLWDEGITSGPADTGETIDDILGELHREEGDEAA